MSDNQKLFLKKIRLEQIIIKIVQVGIVILILGLWEYLTLKKVLNPFIFSSPSRIIKTIISLAYSGSLFEHIFTTLYEIIIAFSLGIGLGFIIAIILYECLILAKIVDPFLTMLNSLPKVALGPIIIIWVGAGTPAIIVMAVAISLVVTILENLNGFLKTDKEVIKMAKTFKATKLQILTKIIIPANLSTFINSLKVNIGLSLVGVIS